MTAPHGKFRSSSLIDCDTEASYQYGNVTVCESCRQNGLNEYLKATAPEEGSKLACNPPASFPSVLSLSSFLLWLDAIPLLSFPRPFYPTPACTTSSSSIPILPLTPPILSSSCQPPVLPVPCPLRHVSGQQRWRLWGGGGGFFTGSVWVQVHRYTVWSVH